MSEPQSVAARIGRFCTQCGVGADVEEDGTCACCGADTCTGEELEQHLDELGLHVVTAADKAVLDAGNLVLDSSLRRIADENGGCLRDWARAELARREALK